MWGWWFETLSRPLWRHRNVDNRGRIRINDLVQDGGNSSALALQLLQSFTKPSISAMREPNLNKNVSAFPHLQKWDSAKIYLWNSPGVVKNTTVLVQIMHAILMHVS